MTTPNPMVVASALGKRVVMTTEAELVLLHDINLSILSGEAVAIVGASGSGKSTLLGLLAGLDNPTSGRVSLDDHDMFSLTEDQRAKLRLNLVGFVFQSFHLLENMTALENVMLPLELSGDDDARQTAIGILERVGLAERLHHYAKQLSGGGQQRVAIARAFVAKPKILFADGPTGNLDQANKQNVVELLIEQAREHGSMLLMVTHDRSMLDAFERVVDFTQLVSTQPGGGVQTG